MSEEFPYGSVVWAKIPSFPWWPARVIKPEPVHLNQLHLSKLRRTQYLVVFYNDNEQIGLCAEYNLSPFENRALHHRAQREKGSLKAKLLKAIEFAEVDVKLPGKGVSSEDPPSKTHDSPRTPVSKRTHASKVESERVKTDKRKRTDSPVVARKNSTSLGKRKSSHRKKVKSDPMQDFIVEEGDDGEELGAMSSNDDSEHEGVVDDEGARRRHKKPKYEKQLWGDTGSEKRHRSERKSSRSHRDLKPVKSEKTIHKSRSDIATPSQRVDVQDKDVHPIKNRSKKQAMSRDASETLVALPSSRPPSLSEEAYKSMMRDTENVAQLSKGARFKMLMEHLRAIRESNVKQWKEGLKNADESTIIQREQDLLKAVVPALICGRRLVRWVAKGKPKTPETAAEFSKLEKQAIEKALAVQNVYFDLASEKLDVAGAKLRDVMKSLADISRAASRCFRDVLILWNDIYVSGPLKECMLDGTQFEQSDFFFDDADSPSEVKEEIKGNSKLLERKSKSQESAGSHATSDSPKSGAKRTKVEQEMAEPEEAESHRREESHRDSPGSSVKERKLEKSHSAEAVKKKNRWKDFSKDKFIQVIKVQLSPLKKTTDDSEHMEFIKALEKQLSALFDPCSKRYYKTGLLMTHGIQRLVKSYKQSDSEEINCDEENTGLRFFSDALKHPEKASKLVDFILK